MVVVLISCVCSGGTIVLESRILWYDVICYGMLQYGVVSCCVVIYGVVR